jgi:hypothetical protein
MVRIAQHHICAIFGICECRIALHRNCAGQSVRRIYTAGASHTGTCGQDQKRILALRIKLDSVRIVLDSLRMPAGTPTRGRNCAVAFQTPLQFYRLNPYAIFRQHDNTLVQYLLHAITTMFVGQILTGVAILCKFLHNSHLNRREF